jgi:hypothetical protein
MRSRTASAYPRQLNLLLTEQLAQAVKRQADARLTTVNAFVRGCILAELERQKEHKSDLEMRTG